MNKPVESFAFISYSRKDKEIAMDLLKKIEKYSYPKEWVAEENRPKDDVYVRPVFLDLTDLSAKTSNFTNDIRDHLKNSRYLIVICSEDSAKSKYVTREIDYFLSTHDNNSDLIVAVYVDNIFSGMHPVIDNIVATRNCPIYVTDKGDAGLAGRKYCFYHVMEFLLKVDFSKLYNRYEQYKRHKKAQKQMMISIVLTVVFALMSWGIISSYKKARMEHARVEFEMGVFPYSLVVGYIHTFLEPVMGSLTDIHQETPDMIILMPADSLDLRDSVRIKKYLGYVRRNYDFISLSNESINIPGRKRTRSVAKMGFNNYDTPIYMDDARTVLAFRSVIKYKLGPDNPTKVKEDDPENHLTKEYSSSFIAFSRQMLPEYDSHIHYITDTLQLGHILDSLSVPKQTEL